MSKTWYFFILLFAISCTESDNQKAKKEKNTLDIRTEFANNIKLYYSEYSNKKAYMTAPKMLKKIDSFDRTFFPEGIVLQIFDSLGNLNSTITARYGEQNHTTQEMKARDSVRVVGTNGQSLKANELLWNPRQNMLYSYGKVAVINQTEIIYGDTLVADETLKRYTMKRVTGIVHVNK